MTKEIEELKGLTVSSIDVDELNETITFMLDGQNYVFTPDCDSDSDERTKIISMEGHLWDLLGKSLLKCEKTVEKFDDSPIKSIYYKFTTIDGTLTVKWEGYVDVIYERFLLRVKYTHK